MVYRPRHYQKENMVERIKRLDNLVYQYILKVYGTTSGSQATKIMNRLFQFRRSIFYIRTKYEVLTRFTLENIEYGLRLFMTEIRLRGRVDAAIFKAWNQYNENISLMIRDNVYDASAPF